MNHCAVTSPDYNSLQHNVDGFMENLQIWFSGFLCFFVFFPPFFSFFYRGAISTCFWQERNLVQFTLTMVGFGPCMSEKCAGIQHES